MCIPAGRSAPARLIASNAGDHHNQHSVGVTGFENEEGRAESEDVSSNVDGLQVKSMHSLSHLDSDRTPCPSLHFPSSPLARLSIVTTHPIYNL